MRLLRRAAQLPEKTASLLWVLGGVASWAAGEHVVGSLLFIAAGVWYRA